MSYTLKHSAESIRAVQKVVLEALLEAAENDNVQELIDYVVKNVKSDGDFRTCDEDWPEEELQPALEFLAKNGFRVRRIGYQIVVDVAQ
jgi:hypothetical protein